MAEVDRHTRRAAKISDDGRYRYALLRRWGDGPAATFILLNPSTADAEHDDPTIRRCVRFARTWGYAALHVVNLYALRATDPAELLTADDPVGPDNDGYLTRHAWRSRMAQAPLVAGWGVGADPGRVRQVLAYPPMCDLRCLGYTADGSPRHPLYMRADSPLLPWPAGPKVPSSAAEGPAA
jgi:hypothetical protein